MSRNRAPQKRYFVIEVEGAPVIHDRHKLDEQGLPTPTRFQRPDWQSAQECAAELNGGEA